MGITTLDISIHNPANTNRKRMVRCMVDSGAVYSVIDKTILTKLGIKSLSEKEFILANGDAIKRKIGGALFSYGKDMGYAPVVFGEKDDSNLLGAVTLEALGMVLDPIRRRLLDLPMVLGGLHKIK